MLRFSTKEAFLQKVPEQTGCPPPPPPGENVQIWGRGCLCPSTTGNWGGCSTVSPLSQQRPRVPPPPPASVHSCARACTPIMSECVFTSSLAHGSPLPALQVGIVLLPLPARAPSEKSAASALPFFPKCRLWMREGGARPAAPGLPLPGASSLGG